MSELNNVASRKVTLRKAQKIRMVGGLAALRGIGNLAYFMREAKGRLFVG